MKQRLFIGIDIPLSVKKKLLRVVSQKIAPLPADKVVWEAVNNIHLTVLFLGPTAITATQIGQQLEKKLYQLPVFSLQLGEVGLFVQTRGTTIIVDVVKTEPLLRLYYMALNEMGEMGFVRSRQQYHPHITLGRSTHPDFHLKNAFVPIKESVSVTSVVVFETQFLKKVKYYIPRHHIQLASPSVL